jgi:aldose 1-epimerase
MAACFPLVPVSGRIADARFRWREQQIAVSRNVDFESNHLHGEGWQRPWSVDHVSSDRAVLGLTSAGSQWPFSYRSSFAYALSDKGLAIEMAMTNTDTQPMPAAIGVHPWFPAPLAHLTARAQTLWEVDRRKLFTRKVAAGGKRDFSLGASLQGADLEHGFTDWDRRALLKWDDCPSSLLIRASEVLSHLVVYTRSPSGDFCVEPVSCSVDAFNLFADGVEDTGTRILDPGDSLLARAEFLVLT